MTTTPSAANAPSSDMRFLRTIPEDKSDLASSLALAPASAAGANSSVRGLDAGREGSMVSSALADLAEEPRQHQTSGGGRHGNHWRRKCSRSSPCVLVSTLLALAGVVVAIVLVTVMDDNDTTEEILPSRGPTDPIGPPTMAPTRAVDDETVQALDEILNQLLTMPVEQGADEAAPGGKDPRTRARQWMLHQDLLRDDLLQAGHAPSVHQRFALVELYYATNGEAWTEPENQPTRMDEDGVNIVPASFLTPQASECTWQGVYCETGEDTNENVYKILLNNRNLTGTCK